MLNFTSALATIVCSQIHGPVIQWHDDPLTSATVTWVERLDSTETGGSAVWREGRAGFGYGDGDDATQLTDMQGRYTRVHIAREFQNSVDEETELTLQIQYDDAFRVWINGEAVLAVGVDDHGDVTSHESSDWEEFRNPAKLRKGANLICLTGYNVSPGSSDFTLHPQLHNGAEVLIPEGKTWRFLAGANPKNNAWLRKLPELPEAEPEVVEVETGEWKFQLFPGNEAAGEARSITVETLPFADTGNLVHNARIQDLAPAQDWSFRIWTGKKEVDVGWFRTAPANADQPISFVTGGDMGLDAAIPINELAGREDPLFALLGGDLAYANGRDAHKWYEWLDNWRNQAVGPNGNLVPMIAVIGNHETGSGLNEDQVADTLMHRNAKFYYTLFELPERRTNFVVDFADYLSVVALDSQHTQSVDAQTEWLRETLAARRNVTHVFACYHRPAWGTGVKGNIKPIQEQWCPLFEEFQIAAAFENDHHVYKRTWPLTAGVRDDERGILYIGDGAWGAGTREITDRKLKSVGADIFTWPNGPAKIT
ncbi:MAG: metallophosphoesterase [Verrucomicrobiota bacterium]